MRLLRLFTVSVNYHFCSKCRAYTICKVWELKTESLRYVVALNPQMWERVTMVYTCALSGWLHLLRVSRLLALRCCLVAMRQAENGAHGAAPARRRGTSRCAIEVHAVAYI